MLLFALIADFDVMVQSLVDAIAFMLAVHIDKNQIVAVLHGLQVGGQMVVGMGDAT